MGDFSQKAQVQVTREVETTAGVVIGAARERLYGANPGLTAEGNTIKSGIEDGLGAIAAVRAGLRAGNAVIDSELVFGLNDEEVEDFMREAFQASEVKVTGALLTVNPVGTHQDGTTGPVITAAATTFADFVTNKADGCMMDGITNLAAANAWPRPIKDLAPDGSQIDIDPLYVTGAAGKFGEPMSAEGPIASCTINLGRFIKNQGVAAARSVNFEFEFTDQTGGSFVLVRGCKGASLRESWDGKGVITLVIGYTGMDYDDVTTTTQGNGTVTANAFIDNDNMVAGEDLSYFVFAGIQVVSGEILTSFNLDLDGEASGIDNVSGNRTRAGVVLGTIDATGSLGFLHQQAFTAASQALARAGTRTPLDWKVTDPAGNYYWKRLPKALFAPHVPDPTSDIVDMSIGFETQRGIGDARTLIIQRFTSDGS